MNPSGPVKTCPLGYGASDAWPDSPTGLVGTWRSDGRILFDQRPRQPWEFMATGTGLTGLALSFPHALTMQINHADSVDQFGMLRTLGRLTIDLAGSPFAENDRFRMEHDLRRSVITAVANTAHGEVRVEVRAHVEMDLIQVLIIDARCRPGRLTLQIEKDYPHQDHLPRRTGPYVSRHPRAGTTVFGEMNARCGFETPEGFEDPLARDFGTGMLLERQTENGSWSTDGVVWSCGCAVAEPAACHRLWIAAGARRHALVETVQRRLREGAEMSDGAFVESHEEWWQDFWQRATFEPEDPEGRLTRMRAAFDLYRYYVACSASERREFPVRFQNDLLRYHPMQHPWSTMTITSIETYQSLFGALRTGNWSALRSRFGFYERQWPIYAARTHAAYPRGGVVIPYETNIWGGCRCADAANPAAGEAEENPYLRHNWAGNVWMLLLMAQYVEASGDDRFAHRFMLPMTEKLVWFFLKFYEERHRGKIVFFPSKAGETWDSVRNSTELLSALHAALPRLAAIARRINWRKYTISQLELLDFLVPPLARGRFDWTPGCEHPPRVAEGDQLVPAESFPEPGPHQLPFAEKPRFNLNRQQTELFAVWPARLEWGEAAVRSYRDRLWQHIETGWALDVTFAATLGLRDEVLAWFDRHFEWTFTLPCGLAREESAHFPGNPAVPFYPSMQGLGTAVLPIFEMLLQEREGRLLVLPCWPEDVPVRFRLYSPLCGRVDVDYRPGDAVEVRTERKVVVEVALSGVEPRHRIGGGDEMPGR